MPLKLLFISGLPIVLLIGIAAAFLPKPRKSSDRLIAVVVPILLYLTVITCVAHLFLYWDPGWDASRLLPSVAFHRGLNVYSTNTQGAVQTTMYPPGWVIAFLPAALASSPTGVILAGYGLAQALTVLPMLVFLVAVAGRTMAAWAAFAIFVFALTRIEPLVVAFRPHADAPGLGFGLTACCLLWGAAKSGHDRPGLLLLSTVAAWFSIWSKQVMAPIIPTMALWLLVATGFRPFRRFCGYAIVTGAAVAAAFFSIFPIEGIVFNVLRIPGRCPWQGRTPWNLLQAAHELLGFGWVLIIPLTAAAIFEPDPAPNESRLRKLAANVWALPALAGLVLSTTSILGRAKVGGWPNTLSPALYFLTAATCLLIADPGFRWGPLCDVIAQRKKFARLLVSVSVVIAALWSLQLLNTLDWMKGMVLKNNAAQRAYDYLKNNGVRDVYFPTMPLAHLMAEGEVFHFAFAVYDREVLARFPMSPEQRRRYFPENPRLVCWNDPGWGTEYVQTTYFSSYTETVRVDDLPDFRCTSRPKALKPS